MAIMLFELLLVSRILKWKTLEVLLARMMQTQRNLKLQWILHQSMPAP